MELHQVSSKNISVYRLFHFTVDGVDYSGINQTITFQVTDLQHVVQVMILDNSAVERVEQFSVFIAAIPGLFPVAVQNNTAMVSISDNDGMEH